jgi:hypothetical protein
MGGKRAKGAWPCASSRTVMPKDQMSASALYLRRMGVLSSAGWHRLFRKTSGGCYSRLPRLKRCQGVLAR